MDTNNNPRLVRILEDNNIEVWEGHAVYSYAIVTPKSIIDGESFTPLSSITLDNIGIFMQSITGGCHE